MSVAPTEETETDPRRVPIPHQHAWAGLRLARFSTDSESERAERKQEWVQNDSGHNKGVLSSLAMDKHCS